MRRAFAASLLALTTACAPDKTRDFEIGLLAPVGPGVASAARAEGLSIRAAAPDGADAPGASVLAGWPSDRRGDILADWAHLRLLVALAAVKGRTGVYFALPTLPDGRELSSYPEEWQALSRVARETAAMRPILESGAEVGLPFAVPGGVLARALRFRGRLYLLLVNNTTSPIPLPADALRPWRALFEVRADARELLSACGGGQCLPAGRVLWLEGRL
ncbi:MAG: hypothetical protein HY923_02455 [Elusimicrobia bacterium]|nr:hypothetical protein [Elusimicrobiota bacterium]